MASPPTYALHPELGGIADDLRASSPRAVDADVAVDGQRVVGRSLADLLPTRLDGATADVIPLAMRGYDFKPARPWWLLHRLRVALRWRRG